MSVCFDAIRVIWVVVVDDSFSRLCVLCTSRDITYDDVACAPPHHVYIMCCVSCTLVYACTNSVQQHTQMKPFPRVGAVCIQEPQHACPCKFLYLYVWLLFPICVDSCLVFFQSCTFG